MPLVRVFIFILQSTAIPFFPLPRTFRAIASAFVSFRVRSVEFVSLFEVLLLVRLC